MLRPIFAGACVLALCVGTVLSLSVTSLVLADHHKGKPWFDLQNCEMCKHMSAHPELMQQMKWETHVIDDGLLSVASVPEEHRATMKKMHEEMEAASKELAGGKEMHLCGFCESYGKLMEQGAEEQHIETSFGMIGMLTSDKPELAEQIKQHAKKTQKEYKAMMAKAESQQQQQPE